VLSPRCEQNCDYPDEEGAFSSLYLKSLEEIFADLSIHSIAIATMVKEL
jgi:hypothetical protein